jgi:prepilin-type N-terminal cleavage/methylation domain-containing protein
MRKAFTMIELVFVIVVLGILAAVALPKFVGIGEQAHKSNIQTFIGTLNGTVGPNLWSKAMADGYNGDISKLGIETKTDLETYTDIPKELGDINLSKCDDPNNYKVVGYVDKTVAGFDENISCKDGSATDAPRFKLGNP